MEIVVEGDVVVEVGLHVDEVDVLHVFQVLHDHAHVRDQQVDVLDQQVGFFCFTGIS